MSDARSDPLYVKIPIPAATASQITRAGPVASVGCTLTIPLQVSVSFGAPTIAHAAGRTETTLTPAQVEVPGTSLRAHRFRMDSLTSERFDWSAALSLALASQLSYESAGPTHEIAVDQWGFLSCDFFEVDDTQCFVAKSADVVVVSFRGTESLADWIANLNVVGSTRSYGIVHRGFHGGFRAVEPQLRNALANLGTRKLLLTGHSLGGALATIAASEWYNDIPVSWIYTYGQPAVGKGRFSPVFAQRYSGKLFRFVNNNDIVPRVPPTFDHIGTLYHFDARGVLRPRLEAVAQDAINVATGGSEPMLTESEFDQLRAQVLQARAQTRLLRPGGSTGPVLEGRLPEWLIPGSSDHRLDEYINRIAAQIT